MTDEQDHYRAKHPAGTPCDPAIAAALERRARNGRITCAAGLAVAAELHVTPGEVGTTADLLECRIVTCQLGLFGYSPEKKIVEAAAQVDDDLRDRILASTKAGSISCAACWEIADELGLEKMAVSAACEHLGLKIAPCQLGAF